MIFQVQAEIEKIREKLEEEISVLEEQIAVLMVSQNESMYKNVGIKSAVYQTKEKETEKPSSTSSFDEKSKGVNEVDDQPINANGATDEDQQVNAKADRDQQTFDSDDEHQHVKRQALNSVLAFDEKSNAVICAFEDSNDERDQKIF